MENEKPAEPKAEKTEPKQKIEKSLKGKIWVRILLPKYFDEKFLGESLVSEVNQILGRTIETSMYDVGGDPNKFYMKIFFKVDSAEGSIARTKFFGHDTSQDFMSRVIHFNSTRIDTNNIVQLKDAKVRIKSLAVTTRPVSKKVEMVLRKKISELISKLSELDVEQFVKKMIFDDIQREIKAEVNKIYPLRVFEIRKSEVIE